MLETWKGRPFGSHNYRADKLYVMSADRRIMLTGMVGKQKVACPELMPEVATSRSASSKYIGTLAENKGLTVEDAITALQLKGHEMDDSSQKLAMLQWALCTAYLNGTIDVEVYKEQLLGLVADGRKAMLNQTVAAKAAVGAASAEAAKSK